MASSVAPRILVIRRRYLGDIVLLGSFLRNLRLHWPEASIHVAVHAEYAGVLRINPDVNGALILPSGAAGWPRFVAEMRSFRFTHVFNFDNTEGTAVLTRLTGAPFRLALHHGGYRVKLRRLYTHVVHDENELHESRHITEYYLLSLAAAGVPAATREVRLVPAEDDIRFLGSFVGAAGPVLLVHPGSRSPARIWPAENFAQVCDRAQEELGVQVVLTGGPGDSDAIAAVRSQAKTHLLALKEPLSLPRFAALAKLSTAVLCHDSGPMHVAAAVGTPVVALYGSQSRILYAPAGEGHVLLQAPMPCTQCMAPDQCVPGDSYRNYCVRRISVDEVVGAVRDRMRLRQNLTRFSSGLETR